MSKLQQKLQIMQNSYYWKHPPSTLQVSIWIDPFQKVRQILEMQRQQYLQLLANTPAYLRRPRIIPLRDPCGQIYDYQELNKIDQGSYGIVFRARSLKTNQIVAVKQVKLQRQRQGYPITSLRQITLLRRLNHQNIIKVIQVVTGKAADQVFIVMEYVQHELKSLLCEQTNLPKKKEASGGMFCIQEEKKSSATFSHAEIKHMVRALLRAVSYLHKNWIFHRDLKTSNILLSNKGTLKLCDFGLARQYSNPIRKYTPVVVTLWYRAPQLLLGYRKYSPAIDIWSVGCIFAEMLLCEPLFPGKGQIDQIDKIFKTLGLPSEDKWPGWKQLPLASKVNFSKSSKKFRNPTLRSKFPIAPYQDEFYLSQCGYDLLTKLLQYNPQRRISAQQALLHPWFSQDPLPSKPKSQRMAEIASNQKDHNIVNRKRSLDQEQLKQREELYDGEVYFEGFKNREYNAK